ncbi:MAG: PKD domain-containing protein [Candidatus Saccharibacteria bacterium]|nr:PKD domain-containing protein [Microbacteriaceae bacterium]
MSTLIGALAFGSSSIPANAAVGHAIIDSVACGENEIPANDDLSSEQVELPFDVNFYGTIYDRFWVNNNGNVTFNGPLSTYTPYGLIATRVPIIAPFFADVDTRGAGSDLVRYGYGETIYEGHNAFCVNWINVGYFPGGSDRLNPFQLLLVDRPDQGVGAFDIVFNYDKVQWEAGSASGGAVARAGFASGSEILGASTELIGSGIAGSFLDSSETGLIHEKQGSDIAGRYVYLIRDQDMLSDVYVALGDSYQSGEGAGDYDPETDRASRYCHRSENAYPHLLVNRGDVQLELRFRACSGALITDLDATPGDTNALPWRNGDRPQLDALGPATKLVTVGIGGNDIGFASVVEDCVKASAVDGLIFSNPILFSGRRPCLTNLGDKVDGSLADLESGDLHDDLRNLYREIRERAPYARVVVLSYPRFFPYAGSGFTTTCQFLRVGDQQWMNDAVIQADGAIGLTALSAGFGYVNMANAFEGNELCTGEPAMNGIALPDFRFKNGLSPESFHPNKVGHTIIADKVAELLIDPVVPSFVITPQQTVSRSLYVSGRSFHVNATWPGSDVEVTLISPSGVRYNRSDPRDAIHGNGATFEYFDIEAPEKGSWTVEMFGADVDPAGEPVTYSAVDEQVPNVKPTAAFTTTKSASAYTFDASASVDSDGTVKEYVWDFGDGTSASGPIVEHTFPAGHVYRVIVSVQDDDGAKDFLASEETVGSLGETFGSSTALTNEVTLAVPVRVNGDFSCNSSGTVLGDVVATGNVYLTNNCRISGSIRANGTISMDSTPKVGGDLTAGGAIRFQSTARVGGSITAGGGFTVTDGKTVGYLTKNAIVAGTITANAAVTPIEPTVQAAVTASASDWPGFAPRTWTEWMNTTAATNAAPSWSQARTSNPGCIMAPWSSSVNGTVVRIEGNTLVDARQPGCARVALQGMTVELAGDLTLFAHGFDSINGIKVQSVDGKDHRFTIVVPGSALCSSQNSVKLSAGTTSSDSAQIAVRVAGKLTMNGTSKIGGYVAAGCFTASGKVNVG